jgi:hypothetical protein
MDCGVHCASFLLCTCTTGMARMTPCMGSGNKRARGLGEGAEGMERKNFLTGSKERRFHGVNPWISSCFLYSLSFWLSTLGIYLLD